LHPSIQRTSSLSAFSESTSSLIIFWSHVAHVEDTCCGMYPSEKELKVEDPERQNKVRTQHKPLYQKAMHEVVLLGTYCYTVPEEENEGRFFGRSR
jgi:hypothetical protein